MNTYENVLPFPLSSLLLLLYIPSLALCAFTRLLLLLLLLLLLSFSLSELKISFARLLFAHALFSLGAL